MYDVVTLGDALVDAFLVLKNESAYCRFDPIEKELCVKHGQKIPLESCSFQLGGNACNVAVGIGRLGFHSALLAEIGNDEFSTKITNGLHREQVDTRYIRQTASQSSFAIGLQFAGERTLFIEHVQRQHAFSFDGLEAKWMYITSLGNQWQEAYRRALEVCKEQQIRIAFNPGTLQLQSGEEHFTNMLAASDLFVVNRDEAGELLKRSPTTAVASLLHGLQQLGPKKVIITDGEHGSYALDETQKVYFQPIVECAIIGKTGAGDSFSTGVLAASLLEHDMQTQLRWGAVNSAAVISHIGAQTGLLKREEMERRVAQLQQH